VTDAELAKVEAPLGLPIGGETCAEIAVSIMGGIIAHHKGQSVSTTNVRTSLSEASHGEEAESRRIEPLERAG
jgi:xanthine/CO dehydrogenase XdhC/CoxF family maturation factor